MVLVCLVNLSLSSLGMSLFHQGDFSLYIHIYIHIHTCLEFGMGIFCFGSGSAFFFDSKEPGWPETSGTGGITLESCGIKSLPYLGQNKIPNPEFDPKEWPQKRQYLLIVQNFKSQKLDSFWFPNTVIRVEITFVFHGFFMSVVMNFKHILASTENKQKKSPPSVGMIFAMQFANRNGGDKSNIYILYIHSTDIYIHR